MNWKNNRPIIDRPGGKTDRSRILPESTGNLPMNQSSDNCQTKPGNRQIHRRCRVGGNRQIIVRGEPRIVRFAGNLRITKRRMSPKDNHLLIVPSTSTATVTITLITMVTMVNIMANITMSAGVGMATGGDCNGGDDDQHQNNHDDNSILNSSLSTSSGKSIGTRIGMGTRTGSCCDISMQQVTREGAQSTLTNQTLVETSPAKKN